MNGRGGNIILRVISGTAKGHKLKTVKGISTRPTYDRVKEAIFNIIAYRIENSVVLDVFAGTGSLGIEALSRGAGKAVFLDKSADCIDVINENLSRAKLSHRAEVYLSDFSKGIEKLYNKGLKFDIIILDPPYNKNFIIETLKKLKKDDIMEDDGIIVAEHSMSDGLQNDIEGFVLIDSRKYGDTMISILVNGKQLEIAKKDL